MSDRLDLTATVEAQDAAERLLEAALLGVDHSDANSDALGELLASETPASVANIWVAAATGQAEAVRRFLDETPELANEPGGTRGWEPLLYLCFSRALGGLPECREGMHAAARHLLDAGADPNVAWFDSAWDNARETPIYGAAGVANDAALAAVLLDAGADPNDGETAYHFVEHEGAPCADVLWPHLDEKSRGTALLHKLDYPDLDGLKRLLELGADPNGDSPFGKYALHQAVFRGHPKRFFDLLFEHGADPNKPDRLGRTPYGLAALAGRTEIAGWLVDHGAAANLLPLEAYIAACAMGDAERARELAQDDPQLAARGPAERPAQICEVADGGNVDGTRLMLERGWDVNSLGPTWSEAAVHRAAMQGHREVVEVLYEAGADLRIRDRSYDASPLGWANHGGHTAIVEFLAQDLDRLDDRDREALSDHADE
ncbi:MAG: hypothetical protein GKS06_14950 [Acidobacteria bacterium]|nr:hypothetical protein [Acidobacteriota bacterium]